MGCLVSSEQLLKTNSVSKSESGFESIAIIDDDNNDWIRLTPFKPTIMNVIPEGVKPVCIDHNTLVMGIQYVQKEIINHENNFYGYRSPILSYTPYIYVYFVDKNNGKRLIKYPKPFGASNCLITFNGQENTLYLLYGYATYSSYHDFAKLNLSTKQWEIYPLTNGTFKSGVKTIVINNEYHVIDAWQHLIWDDKEKKFIKASFKIPFRNQNFEIVFIKSKQILFLFNSMAMYMVIHEYNLKTKIWKKMDLKLPNIYSSFKMVITADMKYIIIFDNGYIVTNKDKYLLVFDIDKYRFFNSSIKHPIDTSTYPVQYEGATPVIINNIPYRSLLIHGYLHKFNVDLGSDIINIIISMHSKEHYCIHALNGKGTHWKVSVDAVISNLEPVHV